MKLNPLSAVLRIALPLMAYGVFSNSGQVSGQEHKPTQQQKDQATQARIDALHGQLLDATRRTAEMSIDQTRKTAEMAIDETKETAKEAIQAALDSNETLKTVFVWSAAIMSAIVALGAFFGWRELSAIRNG